MHLTWTNGPDNLAEKAAEVVANLLERKPDAAIALPTGTTPLGLYRCLVAQHQAGRLTCASARFFNLDEFAGKSQHDPRSYGGFLWSNLFVPLGVRSEQVRLLQGDAPDPVAECRSFERAIAAAGELDLAILGLGLNGHVAFNEPGSDWTAPTRPVVLAEETRSAQSTLYPDPTEVPQQGLTMGIPTIMAARAILLLVSGTGKDAAFAAILRNRPDPAWPATAILDHPNLTVLADATLRANN